MSSTAMLVLGEASESDDEDYQLKNDNVDSNALNNGSCPIENNRSKSEVEANYKALSKNGVDRVVKESYAGRPENYKMSEDTLLHRKLKEKNMQFYSNLTSFNKQMYINATNQMNETNQQLVKAQVLLQDTVTNWKYIEQNLYHIKRKMTDILSEEYIPKIKI